MKKRMMILLTTVLMLSLTACKGTAERQPSDARAQTATESMEQIPNPWQEFASMEEAENEIGFGFTVPDAGTGYSEKTIRVLNGEELQILEVCYTDAAGNEILMRKAPGSGDISGDYTEYQESKTVSVGERSVMMKGNDGTIKLAVWNDTGYTYSLYVSAGLSEADMINLLEQMR